MRQELLELLEQQRATAASAAAAAPAAGEGGGAGEGAAPAAAAAGGEGFTYTCLKGELVLAGVFVRVYTEQPDFQLSGAPVLARFPAFGCVWFVALEALQAG